MKILISIATLLVLQTTALFAADFPQSFVFGVANAPGQVEDGLDDIWLRWGNDGRIASWKVTPKPEERLQFWSKPEVELDLAQKLGVDSFRMGIDWGRVMPARDQFDESAITRYHEILKMVHDREMRLMLTLWHHSVPVWVQESGGWHSDENRRSFLVFAKRMIEEFHSEVEWWITFNEANIFVNNAYVVGMWPPGTVSSPLSFFALGPFRGEAVKAMDRMADAHNEIYTWAHEKYPDIQMGIAHNMAHYRGSGFFDRITAFFADRFMNWHLTDRIRGHMDFFGINYYGAEWFRGDQIDMAAPAEFSESGRAIDANGLFKLMKKAYQRYQLPIMITENGIADTDDGIRAGYLIEHLQAVHHALQNGVPVLGYYVWSLTDNLEWSDGYCPKFGLVAVDRANFTRHPRGSYKVYHDIIADREISEQLREQIWQQIVSLQGRNRPFCRGQDGVTAFDEAQTRPYSSHNWRFTP